MKILSKRKFLRAGILSLLTTSLLSANASASLQKIGVVGAANQTLVAVDESKISRNLALGKDIFFNDTLTTDNSGNAQIMFLDKSALTVGPNASVTIDKFVYNPAEGGGELTMRGTKGAFRFIGGALSKKQEVKFKTPVGTIGIRGGIAIVEIEQNGATNATFLYGDKMTFQNNAGQKQETTSSGFAIAIATPTSLPSIPVAVEAGALAAKVTNFVSSAGETGGATVVPTSKDIESKSVIGVDGKTKDGMNNPTNTGPEGDKKQGDNRQGSNNSGTNEGDNNAATGKPGTASNNTTGQHDGGHATADGGYVDGSGKVYTPAEAAAYRAANVEGGNGGNESGGMYANGTYNNNKGGTADSGRTTRDGGMYANGTNGNNTGGARDPGRLTNDGGYIDANGNARSASDLAAFRRGEMAGGNGNQQGGNGTATNAAYAGNTATGSGTYNTAGGYTSGAAATGGYYGAPATGTYNSGGGYTSGTATSGGYYGAPATGTYNSGGGYTSGTATSGGYYGAPVTGAYNSGGSYIPGTATTGGMYGAPTNTAYNGPSGYSYSNSYIAPTMGYSNYNTTTAMGSYNNYYPVYTSNSYYDGGSFFTYSNQTATATYSGSNNYYNGTNDYAAIGYMQPLAPLTPYVAPIPVNNYITYTPEQITAKGNEVYQQAYNNAIAAGRSTSIAYVAADTARSSFHTHYYSGTEFFAAGTAGLVAAQTYLNGLGAAANLVDFTNMQQAQNTTANNNIGTKYGMNNIAIPVGAVGSQLIEQGLHDSIATFKADKMTAGRNTHCTSCSYVNWDVWANVLSDGYSTTTSTVQAKLVPYVFGTMTPTADIPTIINASYQGSTLINTNIGGTISSQPGTFTADINLNGGSAFLNSFSFGVPQTGAVLNSTGGVAFSGSMFNNLAVSGNGLSGTVNGALFGPTAQNIGGNMNFSNGVGSVGTAGNVSGAGIYTGDR